MIAKSLIQNGPANAIKIFYSYSRKDSTTRDLIEHAIASFEWDIGVEAWKRDEVLQWYDEGIRGGDKWDTEIKWYLNLADIILLFVTKNFFKSEYIKEVEIKIALERERKGQARVIPILIENTNSFWQESDFKYLQPLPQNCLPINEWEDKEAALRNVAQGIVDIIVSEGLLPNSRSRWQLHLDTDIEKFSKAKQRNLIENLRRVAEDKTLRYLKIMTGSVVLTMDSAKDGLNKILKSNQDGKLDKEIGYAVLEIIELLGANVHGGVFISGKEALKRPEKMPDPELILLPSEPFAPMLFKGIKIEKNNPLHFNIRFNVGNDLSKGHHFDMEVSKLMEYLLTAIATPEDEIFVNLAPDENARLLSETLKGTRLGIDLLELDYRLKRLSASLLHPDTESGKEFWPKVFERAAKEVGISELPLCAFQRVWMVPDKATVFKNSVNESNNNYYEQADFIQGFVVERHVKVLSKKENFEKYSLYRDSNICKTNDIINDLFEEMIIPIIETEVNEGKNFAEARQIYNCLILSLFIKSNKHEIPKFIKYIETKRPRQLLHQITNIEPYSLKNEDGEAVLNKIIYSRERSSNSVNYEGEEKLDALNLDFQYGIKLREEDKQDESEKILRHVFNKRLKMYGEDHFQTQVARSQLGRTLRTIGNLREAVKLHEKNLEIRRRRYGNLHEYTTNAMLILADTLLLNGEMLRARALQAEAAENNIRLSKAYTIHENRVYYEKYLNVFKNGVFYTERYDYDKNLKKKILRVYFAGAIDFSNILSKIILL